MLYSTVAELNAAASNAVLVIDCADTVPNPVSVKAGGYSGMIRYASTAGNPKNWTPAQVQADLAAGIASGSVFETTATRATQGSAAGRADAATHVAQARADGMPASHALCLFAAVDEDVPWSAVSPYFAGYIPTVLVAGFGAGPYGSEEIIDGCAAAGLGATGYWQCEAWSGSTISAHATLYQRSGKKSGGPIAGVAGNSYDENVVLTGSLATSGLWLPSLVPPTPEPFPSPGKEIDMDVLVRNDGDGRWYHVVGAGGPSKRWVPNATLANGLIFGGTAAAAGNQPFVWDPTLGNPSLLDWCIDITPGGSPPPAPVPKIL